MSFDEDVDYFNSNKTNLMKEYPNQFILIKDKKVHGTFSGFTDAHKKALELFGVDDVLIVQLVVQQPLNFLASVA
ncbi:MAG: hypothetical protein M0Z77_03460 [Thermoplasmatales archaeon]|nr:hypothetical protein [Thermoplasmatales archaeon]